MPAKSQSQQRLFGMALAVRRGELKRSEVHKSVLDIVDSEAQSLQTEILMMLPKIDESYFPSAEES